MNQSIPKTVDVSRIFQAKNPGLHRYLPGFILRLIARIVHEDEANWFLHTYGHLQGVEFARAATGYLRCSPLVRGLDRLDSKARYAFAANHSLGGLEGIVLSVVLGDYFGPIVIPVNDVLMNLRNLEDLFIPLNMHGSTPRESFRKLDEVYAGPAQVLMFPAGKVSRILEGRIQDDVWYKTFLAKAIQHKRPVVPVFVGGRNSRLFYFVYRVRSFFRIGANLEMFLLPHELFRQKNQTLPLIFGQPVPWDYFHKGRTIPEWATLLREYVYRLGGGETQSFTELYS